MFSASSSRQPRAGSPSTGSFQGSFGDQVRGARGPRGPQRGVGKYSEGHHKYTGR